MFVIAVMNLTCSFQLLKPISNLMLPIRKHHLPNSYLVRDLAEMVWPATVPQSKSNTCIHMLWTTVMYTISDCNNLCIYNKLWHYQILRLNQKNLQWFKVAENVELCLHFTCLSLKRNVTAFINGVLTSLHSALRSSSPPVKLYKHRVDGTEGSGASYGELPPEITMSYKPIAPAPAGSNHTPPGCSAIQL